jgi:hypothetical protein
MAVASPLLCVGTFRLLMPLVWLGYTNDTWRQRLPDTLPSWMSASTRLAKNSGRRRITHSSILSNKRIRDRFAIDIDADLDQLSDDADAPIVGVRILGILQLQVAWQNASVQPRSFTEEAQLKYWFAHGYPKTNIWFFTFPNNHCCCTTCSIGQRFL